jgi:hypothetical protein
LLGEEVVETAERDAAMGTLPFQPAGQLLPLQGITELRQNTPKVVVVAGARPVSSSLGQLLLCLEEGPHFLCDDLLQAIAENVFGEIFVVAVHQITALGREEQGLVVCDAMETGLGPRTPPVRVGSFRIRWGTAPPP